jgi:general secretion pathway protein N
MAERQIMLSRILLSAAAAAMVAIAGAGGPAWAANDSRGLERGEDEIGQPTKIMPSVTPPSNPVNNSGPDNSAATGNPLWGITIESLQAIDERPIFSPSRRPPTAATIAEPALPPPPSPPPPVPDKPAFDLLGTVAGSRVGYAVFLDRTTHDIMHLKTGEGQDGWILQSVKKREAVLVKDDRTAVIRLPSPTGEQQ